MNTLQMLSQMCYEVLSNADVKAICKSRGFSAKEAASRALFENFFLSKIGLETAMETLDDKEVAVLHLLKYIGEPADVSLFARIYGDDLSQNRYYYRTFTQRYKDVFKQTRLSLVRKGVLLLAEDKSPLSGDTKMERWRFRFPQEFERFLPPLIRQTTPLAGDGAVQSDVLRRKLMEAASQEFTSPITGGKQYRLRLVGGELRMGQRPFRARHLSEWQQACWDASLPAAKKQSRRQEESIAIPPIEATVHILGQLAETEAVHPDRLALPLRVFCNARLDAVQICAAGWRWGCLAKHQVDGVPHYRLLGKETEVEVEVEHYLHVTDGRPLVVNLATVPYTRLEQIARISNLEVMDVVQGLLTATPNLVRMGRALESVRESPLTQWLREQAPAFRKALETVEQRWGKQIVHENLLLARISDLGLKVQLEKAFPDSKAVVFLPNDYIAFPRALWTAVQKVVTQSGHVIKTVQAHD